MSKNFFEAFHAGGIWIQKQCVNEPEVIKYCKLFSFGLSSMSRGHRCTFPFGRNGSKPKNDLLQLGIYMHLQFHSEFFNLYLGR